jgi:branched-chain amino acid transport system substrate-binding protein
MTFTRLIAVAAFALTASCVVPAGAQSQAPIQIGVPMPMTGALAQAGQLQVGGMRYAVEEANKAGGVLGRKLELVIEDTKGEPNTAATVGVKLQTQNKVVAFVGGYGSTESAALLQALKRYQPIFVHIGGSASRLEELFGAEPWYFHVYIWDYYRTMAIRDFLESLTPRPTTVAIAYEDGLFGSGAAEQSDTYLVPAGFKVVMKEPFKSGSPDFSPILTRVKALNPDAFLFVGYSGDSIQMARQAKNLSIRPKLSMIVAAGEKRSDFGDFGEGIVQIGEYSPVQRSPGNKEWVTQVEKDLGAGSAQTVFAQGYTAMRTLIDSIKKANSLERDKIIQALQTTTFNVPHGQLKYTPSEKGGKHQLFTNKGAVAIQFTEKGEEVVWPAEKASAKAIYPR